MRGSILAFVLVFFGLAGVSTFGAIGATAEAAPSLKEVQPTVERDGTALKVLPPADHHFNMEAPNSVKIGGKELPTTKTEQQLRAELPKSFDRVDVKTFICDEKKTYCVERSVVFAPARGKNNAPAKAGKAVAVPGEAKAVKAFYEEKMGFWVNDSKAAFAEAERKNLPLFIDFFGIWCPPCNQLDDRVFGEKDFQDFLKAKFVGLKLDSDAGLSRELMKKYNIKYFPTLLVTTPQGDEITRVLGYREKGILMKLMAAAYDARDRGQSVLQAKAAQGDPEAQIALGGLALEREEFADAEKLFAPFEATWRKEHNPLLEKLYRARFGARTEDKEKLQVAEAWMSEFPASIYTLLIYEDVAELYGKEKQEERKKETIRRGLKTIAVFEEKPESDFNGTDFTKGDLYILKASFSAELGDEAGAAKAYAQCNEYFVKAQMVGRKGFGRGEELNRAYCLRKGGKVGEGEAVYRQGMKLYPDDFTFFLGLGRLMLEDKKDPAEGEKQLRRALELAYGNQRVRTSLQLTKALEQQSRHLEALKVVLKELSLVADPREPAYDRLKKKMSELESTLAAPAPNTKQ